MTQLEEIFKSGPQQVGPSEIVKFASFEKQVDNFRRELAVALDKKLVYKGTEAT